MRINIMGSSSPGWEDAPYGNGEVWGVNDTHVLRDVDRIVDVHVGRLDTDNVKDIQSMLLLREKNIPGYFHSEIKGFDNIKRYPIEEIKDAFGTDYFASCIDYAIALAIYEGATEIHIYGVAVLIHSEYAHQKPGIEYWIGYARGRGIKTEVHGHISQLLKTHTGLMYGYEDEQEWKKKNAPIYVTLEDLKESTQRTVKCG